MIHAIRLAAFVVCATIAAAVCSCSTAEAHPRRPLPPSPRARQQQALRNAERALRIAEQAVRDAQRPRRGH